MGRAPALHPFDARNQRRGVAGSVRGLQQHEVSGLAVGRLAHGKDEDLLLLPCRRRRAHREGDGGCRASKRDEVDLPIDGLFERVELRSPAVDRQGRVRLQSRAWRGLLFKLGEEVAQPRRLTRSIEPFHKRVPEALADGHSARLHERDRGLRDAQLVAQLPLLEAEGAAVLPQCWAGKGWRWAHRGLSVEVMPLGLA